MHWRRVFDVFVQNLGVGLKMSQDWRCFHLLGKKKRKNRSAFFSFSLRHHNHKKATYEKLRTNTSYHHQNPNTFSSLNCFSNSSFESF